MEGIFPSCGGEMKVFLDDVRDTPEGWIRTYTVEETIELLETKEVLELSLDNDLGEGFKEGYLVLDFLEEKVYFNKDFPIPIITIHSSNASRVLYMNSVIASIQKIHNNHLKGDTMAISEEFLNVSKRTAQDMAEFKSLVFRLVSIDGEIFLGYPEDTRTDRICVEVEKGKVVVASIQ